METSIPARCQLRVETSNPGEVPAVVNGTRSDEANASLRVRASILYRKAAKNWVCGIGLAFLVALARSPANGEEQIAFLGNTGEYWQVWVIDANGGGLRQITESNSEKARVSWYPDGEHLLVTTLAGEMRKVSMESGNEEPIEVDLQGIHDASVSPDGKRIALSANTGDVLDQHDIWLVGSDGRDRRRLVMMPRLQHEPRWSPDGQWIYFLSGDGQQDHDIWRVSVDAGNREQITAGARYHFEIDVSGDGDVAFSSNRTGDYEIYALTPGEGTVRWTKSAGLDGHPAWSPEGRSIVFHSTRGGSLNLWRQDGPGETARPLTSFSEGARAPEWWTPR